MIVIVALLAAVVWVLGGWERTTPDGVRVVEPGGVADVTPFRVSLDVAAAVYELDGSVADEGMAFVVVDGNLALDDNESVSSSVVGELFAADLSSTYDIFGNPSDEAEPTVEVRGDGSTLLGIGPGMTYPIRLVYVLDEAAVPTVLHVVLREHYERPTSFDQQTIEWYVGDDSARVTLDVVPLPEQRPPAEDIL